MGIIPVTMISRGLKTLILLQHDSTRIFNVSACGDNCARWVLEIAKRSDKDLLINLRHIMDFGDKPYEIKIVNNDKNRGLLFSRAMGILKSTGEYLMNIDPDDEINGNNTLEYLYNQSIISKADIITFNIIYKKENYIFKLYF
jgi:glycosyltransferase involved in cell wall biosynthesis